MVVVITGALQRLATVAELGALLTIALTDHGKVAAIVLDCRVCVGVCVRVCLYAL